MKEPNMFHNYETEKITRKASDVAENLQLYKVVLFFCPRSLYTTTHLMLFSESPPIYASWMVWYGIAECNVPLYRSFWRRGPWAVMCTSHSAMEGRRHNNLLNCPGKHKRKGKHKQIKKCHAWRSPVITSANLSSSPSVWHFRRQEDHSLLAC